MISFAWFQPEPALLLNWIGPVPTEQILAASSHPPVQVVTVIGPPGPSLTEINSGSGIEITGALINLNIDSLPAG